MRLTAESVADTARQMHCPRRLTARRVETRPVDSSEPSYFLRCCDARAIATRARCRRCGNVEPCSGRRDSNRKRGVLNDETPGKRPPSSTATAGVLADNTAGGTLSLTVRGLRIHGA